MEDWLPRGASDLHRDDSIADITYVIEEELLFGVSDISADIHETDIDDAIDIMLENQDCKPSLHLKLLEELIQHTHRAANYVLLNIRPATEIALTDTRNLFSRLVKALGDLLSEVQGIARTLLSSNYNQSSDKFFDLKADCSEKISILLSERAKTIQKSFYNELEEEVHRLTLLSNEEYRIDMGFSNNPLLPAELITISTDDFNKTDNFKMILEIINDLSRDGVDCPDKGKLKTLKGLLRTKATELSYGASCLKLAESLVWKNGKIHTTIHAGQISIKISK